MRAPAATLVTYHYVRPLAQSRYPSLKALDLAGFEAQLDHLAAHYSFVGLDDLVAAYRGDGSLPPNAAFLTFDDGYADHFRYVFPRLFDRGIGGAFFINASAAIDRRVMDVNRIQFALAAAPDVALIVERIEAALAEARAQSDLPSTAFYRERFMLPGRFDEPQTAYVKRLLQFALPEGLRSRIAADLFRTFVSADEAAFADELYLGVAELRIMQAGGMHVGLHGDDHVWLGKLDAEAQARQITGSFRLLDALGQPHAGFTFAPPYGSYNQDTLAILDRLGCALAFSTRSAVATPADPPLELPRRDTNEIPRGP